MSVLNKDQKEVLKTAKQVVRALNHPLRNKILDFIGEKEKNVTSIYQKLKMEQSVASQHLAILRRSGIVATRREGKTIWYSVQQPVINEVTDLCKQLAEVASKEDAAK